MRVAVPLGPAQVHPQQHLGEVGGVDAAGLGADGDQRLARVVLAGQQGADLERVDRLAQRGQLGVGLGDGARVVLVLGQLVEHRRRRAGGAAPRRRRSSPWTCDSRLVTFWAASGSSHRSGWPACSDEVGDLGAQRGQVDDRLDALQGGGEVLQVGGDVGIHNCFRLRGRPQLTSVGIASSSLTMARGGRRRSRRPPCGTGRARRAPRPGPRVEPGGVGRRGWLRPARRAA